MSYFGTGPERISGGATLVDVRQVRWGPASGVPAVTGQTTIDVTHLVEDNNPNALVGRTVNISTTPDSLVAVATNVIAETRDEIKDLLRTLEAVPGLAGWGALDNLRVRGYMRWVYGMAAYSSINANLASAANRRVMLREARFSGPVWYHRFYISRSGARGTGGSGTDWAGALGLPQGNEQSGNNWVSPIWYATVAETSTTFNSWGWVNPDQIESAASFVRTGLASDWNPITYLHG